MEKEIQEAKIELENWLSDPDELGRKPARIEYTNHFKDEDGLECIIFKFKKSIVGKWLLGIVSESGTFSEMKEYHAKNEIDDATIILNMLKEYWKEQARQRY